MLKACGYPAGFFVDRSKVNRRISGKLRMGKKLCPAVKQKKRKRRRGD